MSSNKPAIVMLEDNHDLREIIAAELSRTGFEVSCESNGQAGLKLIRKKVPDLVVLDLLLPRLDGLTLLRTLKEDRNYKDIPVIVLTNLSDTRLIIEGLHHGIEGTTDIPTLPYSLTRAGCANITSYLNARFRDSRIRFCIKSNMSLKEITATAKGLVAAVQLS